MYRVVVVDDFGNEVTRSSKDYDTYELALEMCAEFQSNIHWLRNSLYTGDPGCEEHIYLSVNFHRVFIKEI